MGKTEIALCMGSSCFARGNSTLLAVLEDLIKKNGWQDKVALSGLRCENHCSDGPNIKIDGQLYHGLDTGAVLDLLGGKLGVDIPAERALSKKRRPEEAGGAKG